MTGQRDSIVDFLRRELVGPDAGLPAVQTGLENPDLRGEEVLRQEDPPRVRYGVGILFPGGVQVQTQEDLKDDAVPDDAPPAPATDATPVPSEGGETAAADETTTDTEVNRANAYLPSAIGLTALLRVPATIFVTVSCGVYERRQMPGRGWRRRTGEYVEGHGWYRRPVRETLEFNGAQLLASTSVTPDEQPVPGVDGLWVHLFARSITLDPARADERVVTVTLINRRVADEERARDEDCFFQCQLDIAGPVGSGCIREYPEQSPVPEDDPEELSLRLLYRHRRVYGVGHGCAADWGESSASGIDALRSTSFPTYEIKPIVPREVPGLDLSILRLSEAEGMHAVATATDLAAHYRAWINTQEQALDDDRDLAPLLRERGREHIRQCRKCHQRIVDGAELLRTNVPVRRAFARMNAAMLMQQIHYRISSGAVRRWIKPHGAPGMRLERAFAPPSYDDPARRWYPFQLAFILMNLDGIANPGSPERPIVDVIWFPTGGGKTEAYLGLTAFTVLLRRMRNPANAGTAVLMRYTLRLLTTQQFQRAASLIAACEFMRRRDPGMLGSEPISIGLWVGSAVTPNSEEEALKALHALTRGNADNPFILRSCPWCGAEMGPVTGPGTRQVKGYAELRAPKRVRLVCPDTTCEFSTGEGLPVRLIDQHLYAEPPSLLIGTVDKFAMIPWRPECRTLFGKDAGAGVTPPELIIQDELHLISGPLGSMVGLYETLVDLLCRAPDGRPAKIIASTATIAQATAQILALYARDEAQLFPPQGLRAGESFFARENTEAAGRVYAGVFASGLPSQVTAQVRVLSSLLQAPQSIDPDLGPLDTYWTLMVYFNSIRELGHAATLVRADIHEYMEAMSGRLGLGKAYRRDGDAVRRRYVNRDMELTSRVSSSAVTEVLNDLFVSVGGDAKPIDICLATNMIQVGLDVPRLNLMTIVGQPKTTSEYIQASSRVGRNQPGLVVTIYNPGKPRDRSHFEHFRSYHQAIYRHVEPTSVTPFALPVRDRALHALLIALTRLWGGVSLSREPDPAPDDAVAGRVTDALLERVGIVDGNEVAQTRHQLDALFAEWRRVPPVRYGKAGGAPEPETPLMYPAGSQNLPEWDDMALSTPTSMRNVDATCDARPITSYPNS